MKNPILGPREVVYRNRYQTVFRLEADFGDFEKEYFVTDTGRRAAVVVEGPKGILLTRQYRHLIDGLSWEIPGGRVEEGESFEQAAQRECCEESGLLCHKLEPLIKFQPGLDTYHNPTEIFHTVEFSEIPGHAPPRDEVSHVQWLPLAECLNMVASG